MTFLVEIVIRGGLGHVIKETRDVVESCSQEDLLKEQIFIKAGDFASKRKGSYSITVTELGKAMTFDSNVPRDQTKFEKLIKAGEVAEKDRKLKLKNFKL